MRLIENSNTRSLFESLSDTLSFSSREEAVEKATDEAFSNLTDDLILNSVSYVEDYSDNSNGWIKLNVSAFGETELNRDVEIPIIYNGYVEETKGLDLDDFYTLCYETLETWIENHNSPDNFYEGATINNLDEETLKDKVNRVCEDVFFEADEYDSSKLYNIVINRFHEEYPEDKTSDEKLLPLIKDFDKSNFDQAMQLFNGKEGYIEEFGQEAYDEWISRLNESVTISSGSTTVISDETGVTVEDNGNTITTGNGVTVNINSNDSLGLPGQDFPEEPVEDETLDDTQIEELPPEDIENEEPVEDETMKEEVLEKKDEETEEEVNNSKIEECDKTDKKDEKIEEADGYNQSQNVEIYKNPEFDYQILDITELDNVDTGDVRAIDMANILNDLDESLTESLGTNNWGEINSFLTRKGTHKKTNESYSSAILELTLPKLNESVDEFKNVYMLEVYGNNKLKNCVVRNSKSQIIKEYSGKSTNPVEHFKNVILDINRARQLTEGIHYTFQLSLPGCVTCMYQEDWSEEAAKKEYLENEGAGTDYTEDDIEVEYIDEYIDDFYESVEPMINTSYEDKGMNFADGKAIEKDIRRQERHLKQHKNRNKEVKKFKIDSEPNQKNTAGEKEEDLTDTENVDKLPKTKKTKVNAKTFKLKKLKESSFDAYTGKEELSSLKNLLPNNDEYAYYQEYDAYMGANTLTTIGRAEDVFNLLTEYSDLDNEESEKYVSEFKKDLDNYGNKIIKVEFKEPSYNNDPKLLSKDNYTVSVLQVNEAAPTTKVTDFEIKQYVNILKQAINEIFSEYSNLNVSIDVDDFAREWIGMLVNVEPNNPIPTEEPISFTVGISDMFTGAPGQAYNKDTMYIGVQYTEDSLEAGESDFEEPFSRSTPAVQLKDTFKNILLSGVSYVTDRKVFDDILLRARDLNDMTSYREKNNITDSVKVNKKNKLTEAKDDAIYYAREDEDNGDTEEQFDTLKQAINYCKKNKSYTCVLGVWPDEYEEIVWTKDMNEAVKGKNLKEEIDFRDRNNNYYLDNAVGYDDVTIPEAEIEYYKSFQPNMNFSMFQSSDDMWWVRMEGTLEELKDLTVNCLGWFPSEEFDGMVNNGTIKRLDEAVKGKSGKKLTEAEDELLDEPDIAEGSDLRDGHEELEESGTEVAIFHRKPASVAAMRAAEQNGITVNKSNYRVIGTKEMSSDEFEQFANHLSSEEYDWLKEYNDTSNSGEFKCVEVKNTDDDSYTLLVDPQGYNYARYAAIKDKLDDEEELLEPEEEILEEPVESDEEEGLI